MPSQFFVIYTGNLDVNPLDKGCENFPTKAKANAFIKTWANNGYICQLFEGVLKASYGRTNKINYGQYTESM
jgi:hypothetical protein